MYFEDDFYDEYSEFDTQVEEFKNSLRVSVKQEIKDELEKLRKENSELSETKKRLAEIEQEHQNELSKLRVAQSNAKSEARRERLSKLLESLQPVIWSVDNKSVQDPKCDKCDKDRKISYITPLGKPAKEDCACSTRKTVYFPTESRLVEFKTQRDNGDVLSLWYKQWSHDSDSYTDSVFVKHIYESGDDFPSLNAYGLFFRNKDDCQSYCDWLNINKK